MVEYGYDAASRVTSISYKQNGTTLLGDLTYEYDKAGNRTKIAGSWARTGMPEPLTTTSYDANNRQLTFGDKTLAYDDNGNLQSITDSNGTTLYQWNVRNQLVGISGPTVSAGFLYDGLGRREAKTINGNLTEFLYDGVNPVQETSGATVVANILTAFGIDERLSRTDVISSATSYFLVDALGSPVGLSDSAGMVQTEYAYEPFGNTGTSGGSNSNPYQFTGRENDDTGIYYFRARYYHSGLKRFISEDPIGLRGGINTYGYVRANPIRYLDPFGLRPLTDCEKDRLRPYIPQEDLDNADLHDGEVPWYLREGFDGITRGNDIYFRPGVYDPSSAAGISLLGHELVHVGQYRQGMTWLSYLLEALRNGYRNSKYEKEAYDKQEEIRKALDSNGVGGCPC